MKLRTALPILAVSAAVMLAGVAGFQLLAQEVEPTARLLLSVGVGISVYVATFQLLFPDEVKQVRQAWALLRGRPAAQPG